MNSELILQLTANGLAQGALYAVVAVGFGLVYRSLRFFDISYGAYFVIGPYILFMVNNKIGMPLWAGIFFSLIGTTIFAGVLYFSVYSRLLEKKTGSQVLLVVSLGISIIVENVIALRFGNQRIYLAVSSGSSLKFGTVSLSRLQVVQTGICLFILIFMSVAIRTKIYPKTLWALGDDPELLDAFGLSSRFIGLIIYMCAGFLAACASALSSLDVGMDPHIGLPSLLTAAVAVMIGGADSWKGWIFGGLILALIQNLIVVVISYRWSSFVSFALLIAILLFKPTGLFGVPKRVEDV